MRYKQKQVAKILGLNTRIPLSEWEKGRKLPSAKHLLQLSVVYRTYPNELYYEYMQELKKELNEQEWDNFTS